MNKEIKVMPIVRNLLEKTKGMDIVATIPVKKRYIDHKNIIVGELVDGVVRWFDCPEAEEKKKLVYG